jgi:hypothetical protein
MDGPACAPPPPLPATAGFVELDAMLIGLPTSAIAAASPNSSPA